MMLPYFDTLLNKLSRYTCALVVIKILDDDVCVTGRFCNDALLHVKDERTLLALYDSISTEPVAADLTYFRCFFLFVPNLFLYITGAVVFRNIALGQESLIKAHAGFALRSRSALEKLAHEFYRFCAAVRLTSNAFKITSTRASCILQDNLIFARLNLQ